ncbi:hypothetical protein AB0903_30890, partial [Streptomyces sp. NPDC048389]|uniref:hypothetical protein n=1 Tax=Streptomyces sp. NPDC048389 TaxID=3154622 RepID=UPI0034569EE9
MSESTGVPAVDSLVVWSLAAVAICAGLGLLWRLVRGVRRIATRVDDFVDDWQGVPPRPGVPERKGVMERLDGIEERLTSVEHELHPNSGQSLRDAVDRVDVALNGPPP